MLDTPRIRRILIVVIRFTWMLLTACAFMAAGALLAYGEFKVGGVVAAAAWIWMAFPKVTLWTLERATKAWTRRVDLNNASSR